MWRTSRPDLSHIEIARGRRHCTKYLYSIMRFLSSTLIGRILAVLIAIAGVILVTAALSPPPDAARDG